MSNQYLQADNPTGIRKLVTVDKTTTMIYCKFNCIRPDLSNFIDGGFTVFAEDGSTVIDSCDEYFSLTAAGEKTFNLAYPCHLTIGQRIIIRLQSSGAPINAVDTPCFRNISIATDPIP